jgi:hypothetical protein
MARTVGDDRVQTRKRAGVKRLFNVLGDSVNGFTDALDRAGGLDWVHARHGEAEAFAAGPQAHPTGELTVGAGSCKRRVVTRRAVLGGAAATVASPAFARPLWPSVPPLGIRVDVSRGARARVHTFSFDGAAAQDSLHVIELLDQLIVVGVNERAIAWRDLDQWCRVFAKPIARRYATSPGGGCLEDERSNFAGMPTPDRARAGIEIISGEPIEVRRVARGSGEWVLVGLPRDRILITGDIVVNGSPDQRYRGQTMEQRAAIALCQSLPYTRILPSSGRPAGRELYESMLYRIDSPRPRYTVTGREVGRSVFGPPELHPHIDLSAEHPIVGTP